MSERLKAWVLNKLKRHRYIGGKHTDITNVRKGADPKNYSELESIMKNLIKSANVLVKITSYGKHVSLNPRMIKEIDEFVRKNFTEAIF